MPRLKKSASNGAAGKSELNALQRLVVKALMTDIEQGIEVGEVNQAAIRNALQLLRDNTVVCTDDLESEFDRLSSLLPKIDTAAVQRVCTRYE